MAVFTWEGRTRQGQVKKGTMEAVNEAAVMAQLRAQMIQPTTVKSKADAKRGFALLKPGIKTRELVIFTRQFATMIDAGLPLVQCLDILADQQPNVTFKAVLKTVKSDVEQGSTFADALRKHPKPFDELYVNLVAAGEVGGILDTILNRLSVYLEKADALARKVKGAMVYPITILVVAIGVMALLLVKVIPVFEKMFKDFGGALPGPTQMVLNLSHFMQSYILYMIAAVVGVIWGFREARARSARFRFQSDAVFLKLWLFGPLLKKVAVARFSRTLGTMISSGVPILDALDICARTAGNKVIEAALQRTRSAISEGKTIAEPLGESRIFPGMVVQMVAVGEQTGAMDSMLNKIADFYDDEVDAAVSALTAMMEPLMMVVLGGSIGSILVAMYLPIFKIAEAVK
ncbi:MAG TPA: type II secretion system F family protein [Myxococcota bacterium]|jgi:type IV pilus assembly protein PilC|nr:type II secretion system F family protein [Myxococcota bacterium]